ncbi:polyphosphate kinase 1 [Taibaiella koreensis]|uniref:polyphosphate kinase 1 n=1 Tax=Taibaiella koreensis TaxID=1268548 RepID=UPI0013C2EE5D|nr:polyphosphate kinase 1 [Taibaiella koreensis]
MNPHLTNRDISWLSFNGRVLLEATRQGVPLLERLKFLSIYSSNLDEFYRVRIPALIALSRIDDGREKAEEDTLDEVSRVIAGQQQTFGRVLREALLPSLEAQGIRFVYRQPVPELLKAATKAYFLSRIAAFLQLVRLSAAGDFFPENNKIYFAIGITEGGKEDVVIVNIPAPECGRFYTDTIEGIQYVLTIDDIIKDNLAFLVPGAEVRSCYSFKITRDAELDLADEFKGDIAEKIEQQINIRDLGLATRLLYDAGMPAAELQQLVQTFHLENATQVEGGAYHNLRDLADFPVKRDSLSYERWPSVPYRLPRERIFDSIQEQDMLLHVPYHSYDTVLQFFNEAALDPLVTDISITLYRMAGDSLIGNALMSAARNGKNVTVFVELKARFDEANNIRWSKRLKAAGVKIIYSIPGLKVHAKVALVKRKVEGRSVYYGLLATGNFNEGTARFYTDHILMTTHKGMLRELELLFIFLAKRREPGTGDRFTPEHLLVAQFNLQNEFLRLIGEETTAARQGKPASICIKLNNLEEEVMINKLYEAAQAGVKITLLIRGICRLKPGVPGLSEGITVKRIVDRYLEHGRIFIFHNNGDPKVYLGSADWMNRNIYRRIEVCFPVYDTQLKAALQEMMRIQLADTGSAVTVDAAGNNTGGPSDGPDATHAQQTIYQMIKQSSL